MMRYDKYKDSGVEWIGEIPEHWEMKTIRYILSLNNEKTISNKGRLLSLSQYTGVSIKDDNSSGIKASEDTTGYNIVKKGQFVMNIMLAWNGSYAVSKFDGIISPAYCVFDFISDCCKDYYHYLLRLKVYSLAFKTESKGIIDSRLRLYPQNFKNFPIVFPPLSEQRSIADYLDKKCADIDKAVSIQQRRIELLKKLKQSTISQAVTRGLNPNVKMKDSGVEWIGEVPEHWEVKNIKYILKGLQDGTHGTYERINNGKLLLSAKNVFDDGIHINDNESCISETDYNSIVSNGFPQKGDILLCCVGTIGRCCIFQNDTPIAFQRSVAFMRPYNNVVGAFLCYELKSTLYIGQLERLTKTSAQSGIYLGDLAKTVVIIPPLSEQRSIADYLDNRCAKIDKMIANIEAQVKTYGRLKQSLISEVVTGKRKI